MEKHTSPRIAVCYFLIAALMFVGLMRVLRLTTSENYAQAADTQNSKTVTVFRPRGTIYDANLQPLVGVRSKTMAVVPSTPQAVMALADWSNFVDLQTSLARLEAGNPILVEVPKPLQAQGVVNLTVPERYDEDRTLTHILGYLDYEGHGVCGIEAAYDDALYSEETIAVRYAVDAKGDVLPGVEPEILGDASITQSGVALTIDRDVQQIVQQAMDAIPSGAALVLDAADAKIRALVSRPDYDPNNVSESLKASGAPLMNRALAAYNVGSVFKPLVACAALEQGVSPSFCYTCVGQYSTQGVVMHCHNLAGHGEMNMESALEQSCNTYFFTLAQKVGPSALYQYARLFGFGQQRVLADGITQAAGSITSEAKLSEQTAAVANFAIGQGDVLLSPLAVASLYQAIVNGGCYNEPTLIEGTVENGALKESLPQPATSRVMSEQTAALLKSYLISTVENGNAKAAQPDFGGAGGKTATAETGAEIDGKSVTHGWFCGFYPKDEPKYVVVIFAENNAGGGVSCAPVFQRIANEIARMPDR